MSRGRLDWRWLLTVILIVILFVPMRRYALPVELPFELEPYRIIVALAVALWTLSLLAQPDVAFRRSGLEGPVFLYTFALVASDFANPGRAAEMESYVIRALTLALSIVVVFYFVVSVVRTFSQVLTILKVLVAGSSVLAGLAMIESRTGWSPFQHLHQLVPLLQQTAFFTGETRGAIRALGSAEHPIALGALFVIVAPLALYLALRFGRWWWATVVILMAGTFATISRTAVLMMVAAGLVFLVLRFRETWRLAPLLIPMVIMVHAVVPGALGAVKLAFTPPGGLIAEHQVENEAGEGRLADVGPSLGLFREKPVLGYGFGTMQTTGPDRNAAILDNQWLSSLLNVGLVGLLSLVWLFTRFIREVGRRARHERTVDGWLLVGLVASVVAFGVGMFTYDAFAFTQVTFVFFVILALASVLVLAPNPVFGPSSQPTPGRRMRPVPVGDTGRLPLPAD